MEELRSLKELPAIWPANTMRLKPGGNEYEGPCPFCPKDHSTTYKIINGETRSFTGADRFIVWIQTKGCYCRNCAQRGEGRNGNGWYSLKDVSQRLGFTISDDLKPVRAEDLEEDDPITMLWSDAMVANAHKRVDYDWWFEKCGWSRELVDEFQLGYGTLYQRMGEAHLIPMHIQKAFEVPLEGWYLAARKPGQKGERNPGSSKHFFWLVEKDRESKTVVLCESEKNNPTHVAIGYKNTVATFGAGNKNKKILEYLWSLGYRHLILAGDNDDAGREMTERFGKWAQQLKYETVRVIDWPTDFKVKGDTTDLHADNEGNSEATRIQFDSWLSDFALPQYEETIVEDVQIVDLEELRGEGPNSIYGTIKDFLGTYTAKRNYGRGRLLLLAVPPGAGKTHTSVRVVQELARDYLVERAAHKRDVENRRDDLVQEYESAVDQTEREELSKAIHQLEMKLEDWSVTAVAWFGQYVNQWADLQRIGIDPDLWYDFKARSEENCGNFDTVQQLAMKHHDIGAFCKNGCPLREMCKANGYLSQEKERHSKPITFFRHGNLPQPMASEYPKGLLIDENPTALWEQFLSIDADDLYPFYPERETYYQEDDHYQMLKTLMTAIRAAMSANAGAKEYLDDKRTKRNPEYRYSGAAFYRLVENQLRLQGTTLPQIMDDLKQDAADLFHPNFISMNNQEAPTIRLRCVPDLLKTMQRELVAYIENPMHRAPSCVHLISGKLLVFPVERLTIPSRVPVIVADGTALPQLYEAMFNRDLEIFRPEIRNPNCRTIIIGGSDWLKSVFNREVGPLVQRRKKAEKQLIAKSDPSKPINFEDLPMGDDFNESKFIEEAIVLIKGVAEENEKLLVIGFKDLRYLLEDHLVREYPHLKDKVAWGHYGAMRGTNFYEDYPAVLLIGAFRIPYDAAYLYISMWATLLGITEEIDDNTVQKFMRYDGQQEGYEYRTFENPFADAYVNAREQAEMRQSVERIRPHASQMEKTIYVAAGRPAIKAVTEVVRKKEFLDRYRVTKDKILKNHLLKVGRTSVEMFGKIVLPTFAVLEKEFKMSRTDITKVRKAVIAELTSTDKPV
jgi:hypothetical protein